MNQRIIKMLAALLGFAGVGHAQKRIQTPAVVTVDAASFAKAIAAEDVQLVDVRTPEEYADGHIQTAVNIDVNQSDFVVRVNRQLDKKKVCYVYCRSGKRSLKAAQLLKKNGFKVVNLRGGYLEWKIYKGK